MNRRKFVKSATLSAAAVGFGCDVLGADQNFVPATGPEAIKAVLLHLGYNMWCDWFPPDIDLSKFKKGLPDTKLRCKEDLWRKVTDHAAEKGMNMVVIDLGEGVVYPSHPELAIDGSWSVNKLRAELDRLRGMGLEPIPKLNFSTTHNGWLKHYRRMLSTPGYYKVCEDVLRDAYEIFGHPRFIHIGSDEETAEHQNGSGRAYYISVRTGEFWMHDFLHIVHTVEKLGARPWAWSDYGWNHPEFMQRCPKSVVLSNWYYDECYGGFDPVTNKTADHKRLINFWDLEKAGYDQLPCGTNWVGWKRRQVKADAEDVIGKLVKLGRKVVTPKHLLGFLMAPWASTDDNANTRLNIRGIDLFAEALRQPRG